MPKKTNSVVKKPTVKFSDTNIIHTHRQTQPQTHGQTHTSKPLKGGIKVKDDPDKADKDEFESEDEDAEVEQDDDVEEKEESDGEDEETEESEKEEFDKEKDEDGDDGEGGDDDECVYKLTKKKNTLDVEIEVAEDNFEDEDVDDINSAEKKLLESKYVKDSDRKTKPFLFEFERVRILGERARQLSLGAKPMLKNLDNMNPKYVARLELEKKVIPLIILRELPNGLIEKWKVSELIY